MGGVDIGEAGFEGSKPGRSLNKKSWESGTVGSLISSAYCTAGASP
jgi:hypothetical protein